MSYILEALKKAQAERQLGSAPTLLAVPLGAAPAKDAARRLPTWRALSTLFAVALAMALAVLAWRFQSPATTPAAHSPVQLAALPAALPAPLPDPAPPLAVVPPSVAVSTPTPAAPKPAAPKPAAPKLAAPKPAAPEDETLPSLRDLPESIRHAVPPLVFGGYMYSKNPADRLLLIDKALRREGEEVAPGLVLEKLLPKAAVLNYKGYRYRVPY